MKAHQDFCTPNRVTHARVRVCARARVLLLLLLIEAHASLTKLLLPSFVCYALLLSCEAHAHYTCLLMLPPHALC
jgi:hypothetical protein